MNDETKKDTNKLVTKVQHQNQNSHWGYYQLAKKSVENARTLWPKFVKRLDLIKDSDGRSLWDCMAVLDEVDDALMTACVFSGLAAEAYINHYIFEKLNPLREKLDN